MNEEQKRIDEAWDAFYKSEEALKNVKAHPEDSPIKKKRLEKYKQDILVAKVQELLPKIPTERIREFITDLQDILKNFDEKTVHAFINDVAMAMRNEMDMTPKKVMRLAINNIKKLNKKISQMNDELQGFTDFFNVNYIKFYTYFLLSDGILEAKKAYNSLTELQKLAIQIINDKPASPRGREPAEKDSLVLTIAILFNEFFKRPSTNPLGPFYKIVQKVRDELGRDSVDPSKSVKAAVATLRKRRFVTIKEEVEEEVEEEEKSDFEEDYPPDIVII